MDMDKTPRYPQTDSSEEYELIEKLLSGNSCKLNNCDNNHTNSACAVPNLSSGVALAMVYSPFQYFEDIYEPEKGLDAGTIFAKLDKPFAGRSIAKEWKK